MTMDRAMKMIYGEAPDDIFEPDDVRLPKLLAFIFKELDPEEIWFRGGSIDEAIGMAESLIGHKGKEVRRYKKGLERLLADLGP